MSGNSPPNYKALFLKAEEERKRAEEERKRAEERERQAEERQRQAEERERQQRERNRPTTFLEFIRLCHDLLWRPLRAQTPSRSTTGKIPAPLGKHCPLRLRPWTDWDARELFTSLVALQDYGRRFVRRPISSEQDLETYERLAVEDYVHDIVAELCKIPEAREEFRLGNGIWFDNHPNALDDDNEVDASQPLTTKPSKPDQFCIYQRDGNRRTLLTTVEYKPPYKLSAANLRPEQLTSEYLTSSSPITSGSRVTTRAAASCALLSGPYHYESSSDSEADPTVSVGRKRGFS
ncbi:unnamed protein product [Penicillium viridicatum]